jgi:sugar lactone lactonase YvrE
VTCTAAFAQQPRIAAISPSQGLIAGGTIVTIAGANFTGATVTLDRVAITPIARSDSEIRLQMPPHVNGYSIVSIRASANSAYAKFLYVPPPLASLPAGYITTVAGVGLFGNLYGPATEALIHANFGFVFDGTGKTYIADAGANRVYVVQRDGTIEPFAGDGDGSFNSDRRDGGQAIDATISYPHNVALDGAGNVYIPDARYFIRRVRADGIIETIAGTGKKGFSGDGGPAIAAKIGFPSWIAADRDDIFFIDDDVRIRRIHLADLTISTLAGDGTSGFGGDGGPATQARWSIPGTDDGGLTLDSAGNVYLLDTDNGRIRRIDRKSGIIETVLVAHDERGPIVPLTAMTVDRDGSFYCSGGGSIVKASADGTVVAQWGNRNGPHGFSEDGTPAVSARFAQINYLAVDPSGNIAFSDSSVADARRISVTTGVLETIAGSSPRCFAENGPAIAAAFNPEGDIDITSAGDLLIADGWNSRIRRLDQAGNLTTIGGNGTLDGPIDGVPATSTGISPLALHSDATGIDVTLFGKVARIDSAGVVHVVTRFIGGPGGICQYSGDGGPAISAGLCQPWDTARDRDGNLFVADTNNNRIRRIDARTGIITTVAGNGGPFNGFEGYGNGKECGDGGPAIDACLNTPYGLVFDRDGNLFASDSHSAIRKIDPQGRISTIATFNATKLRSDTAGSLFGVGSGKVVRLDRSGMETILAGGAVRGFAGDGGPARSASLGNFDGQGLGVAIDRDGNLYFFDGGNWRVRAVRYGAVLAPVNASIQATASGAMIRATVFHANGRPAPSVRVDFTTPASGASCTLSSSFAVTDADGMAIVSCTSNCIAGTYSVTARPLTASSSASVSFTNPPGPCRRRSVHR